MRLLNSALIFSSAFMLTACVLGPNYMRPCTPIPVQYKEAAPGWKQAQPQDACERGQWWKKFNDAHLNALEDQLNICNQNIAAATAQYFQARALVAEARAAYFPTVAASAALSRQKNSDTSNGAGVTENGALSIPRPFTLHSLSLDATWEPDLWGSVQRTVESKIATAQATAAQVALTRLSAQASLAQYYFELRGVDKDQQLLDDTVVSDQKILKYTQNRYKAGVAGLTDVVQARSQLETAQALALNNGINRGIYEHAIAVLIGQPPAVFCLAPNYKSYSPPCIPLEVPSALLERRPDVAQAERNVASANALIGVAVAAYFPTLTLTASGGYQGIGHVPWIAPPLLNWSIGANLAQTILDGGLRGATLAAAKAGYQATVATYRQTVLSAFQDVEDNLISLKILNEQTVIQDQAAADATLALKLITNQYKAGTADYSAVLVAQVTAYNAQRSAIDVSYLRMTSAVGLLKALGGDWDSCVLNMLY